MDLARRCAAVVTSCLLLAGCASLPARPAAPPTLPTQVGGWVQVPDSPLSARHEAAGAFLDGRFYVVGGRADPPCPPNASCAAPVDPGLRDGAAFDPRTGLWRSIAPAPTPVSGVLHLTVVGGRLYLLTGDVGRDDSPATFLAYDPVADAWSTLPRPPGPDPHLVAAGSRVVSVAGSDERHAAVDAVFDPAEGRWQRLPDDPLGPSFDRDAAWLDGRLLLTASDLVPDPGADGPALTRLAVLEGSPARWRLLPDSDIIGGSPTWVSDRVVFPTTGSADGGDVGGWGRDHAYGAVLDPATGTWTDLPQPRQGHSGLEGSLGTVGDRTLVGGQLLEPRTGRWTLVPPAPWGRADRSSQTVVTGADSILVWGGGDGQQNLGVGYLLRV